MAENERNNVMRIVVDEGSVKVPICNKFGDEIGVFYFQPTDIGMVDRYNKAMSEFDKITETARAMVAVVKEA